MITLQLPSSSSIQKFTPESFEAKTGVKWLPSLYFLNGDVEIHVKKRSARAIRKKELNTRERWLGVRMHEEIVNGSAPNVSIRWVGEAYGYGVFAEKLMPKGTFIGEYTGIVRRRTSFRDRKNSYCFEYTIGDWLRNPYIIDAEPCGNHTRFINHSDQPNCEPVSVYAQEVMHIILVSIRPIQEGEQISYHYGDYFWKKRRRAKALPT